MGKRKRKLSAAEKAEKRRRKALYEYVFIGGKMKRVRREPTIDGIPVEEFIRRNATPDWLHANEMWWMMEEEPDFELDDNDLPFAAEENVSGGTAGDDERSPPYTAKQGQYLAFIYYYTKIHRVAPAEADIRRYFGVSAPAVHQMLKALQARGLIDRTPGTARSIRLRLSRAELPDLE